MDEPQVIHVIPKHALEEIRVAICEYKNHHYADLRTYYRETDGGQWKPSKKGVTLSLDLVDELVQAVTKLQQAVDKAPQQRRLRQAAS